MSSFFENLRRVNKSSNVYPILRRYFAMNAFDGVITTLGVIMGAFIADISDSRIILVTVLSTSFALFVSGMWSAYITELAERKFAMHELEKKMLHSLEKSRLAKSVRLIALEAALVDGISPFAMALLILTPFFIAHFSGFPLILAFQCSVAISLSLLALLGAYLAVISRQDIFVLGLKMVLAGILAIFLSMVLEAI